jgi:hypothetical protein
VAELAFGTNHGITRFMRNTPFDEKIGGTMHIGVGTGFTVYGDGQPFMKNGRWLRQAASGAVPQARELRAACMARRAAP